MKTRRVAAAILATLLVVAACAGAKKSSTAGGTTIAGILAQAKCPLSSEQQAKIAAFKPGGDPRDFRSIYDVFEAKQTAALGEVFGMSPSFGGGADQPRMLFLVILFENAGCPFSSDQIQKIKAMPAAEGREMFQQMQALFSEEQNTLMQGMFNR